MTRDALKAEMASLWLQHRLHIMDLVGELEHAAEGLEQGQLDAESLASARDAAHKLTGAAGMFGFADATSHIDAAREIMRAAPDIDDADQQRLLCECRELRRILSGPSAHPVL